MAIVTTNLIDGRLATLGSGGVGLFTDSGASVPAASNGDNILKWVPLAAGNTCGNGTGGTHTQLQLNEFGAGGHGVRGLGTGDTSSSIQIASKPAVGDFDLFVVFKFLAKLGAFARLFDAGVAAGMWCGETGSANQVQFGYCNGGSWQTIAATDGAGHVLHARKAAAENSGHVLVEIDGHAVNAVYAASGAGPTDTTPMCLFGASGSGGSPSNASIGAVLLHSPNISTTEVNTQYAFLGSQFPALTISGASGGYLKSRGFNGGFPVPTGGF